MSSNLRINSDTGAAEQGVRAPRLTLWIAFLLFSTITLGASVEVKRDNAEIDVPAAAKWAVACAAISFVLTLFVVVGHLIPLTANFFVGTMVEGVLTFVLICFWAATVSIVTNASNGLSVSEADATNQVSNGNLYYFSWAGFVTSIVIMVDYLRSSMGVDVVGEMRNRSARLTLWAGLLAASLVVMGSSARVFGESCTSDDFYAASYCKRTKFGIALGTITMTLAVVVVALKLCLSGSSFLIEFVSAFLLSIMNAFGVAYITSSFGPGSAIGNLYYFSWISFLCSAFLSASCFDQFKSGNAGPDGGISSKQSLSNGISAGNLNGHTHELDVETIQDSNI